MKYSFLIHNLNHTTLLVDITAVELPNEIYPSEGRLQTIPSLRFQSWASAEKYLIELGADERALHGLKEALNKTDVGVLTIT
jgi:hypothetical protein